MKPHVTCMDFKRDNANELIGKYWNRSLNIVKGKKTRTSCNGSLIISLFLYMPMRVFLSSSKNHNLDTL